MAAALMCYFLRDALQQLFYDPVWVRHIQQGREHARYWKSPEGQRVKAILVRLGYDINKVRTRECSLPFLMYRCLRGICFRAASCTRRCHAAAVERDFAMRLYANRCSSMQVSALDVAIDGVEMRNSKPHSTRIETVRCSAVHDAFKSKMRNVQAFLIIPGPRGPDLHSFPPHDSAVVCAVGPECRCVRKAR